MRLRSASLAALLAAAAPATAQQVNPEVLTLENGMKFLLLQRTEEPNSIIAGWVANVGSVNEHPGITGISHFFEHMMFKGTTTIGTKDAARDRELIEKLADVRERLLELQIDVQYPRFQKGEIDDPWDAQHDTPEMKELRDEMQRLMEEQRENTIKDEFDQIYTRNGGSFMNAMTNNDMTFYFVSVPSNKFELWCWMESDRLSDSVFREFYAERDVVHEERRLRTESTPTGIFDEEFDAMFWQSSPYSWPVVGWPSDLNSYTRAQAEAYFDVYYRPNNLVAVIVGDFDPEEVRTQVRRYFSRLEPGPPPPPVVTTEMKQLAEMRMEAECDCQPQIEVRYHAVPFGHVDSFPLEMLAEVLNGRTGRLYKNLVEGKEIASSASAGLDARKYGGSFSFYAECKGDATPRDLEQAWYEVLKEIQDKGVSDQELQKVKNQTLADSYRRLNSNFFLMFQLAMYENAAGWEYINEGPQKLLAVTPGEIQRVARKYFEKSNRAVATYTRKEGAAPDDPDLAAVPPEMRGELKKTVTRLMESDNVEQLQQIRARIEGNRDSVSEEARAGLEYMVRKLNERIAELEGQGNG